MNILLIEVILDRYVAKLKGDKKTGARRKLKRCC